MKKPLIERYQAQKAAHPKNRDCNGAPYKKVKK